PGVTPGPAGYVRKPKGTTMINITINIASEGELTAMEQKVLNALTSNDDTAAAPAPAKPAPAKAAAKKPAPKKAEPAPAEDDEEEEVEGEEEEPVKKAPARRKAAPKKAAPKKVEEPEVDEPEDDSDDAEDDAGEYSLDDAVKLATSLVSDGRAADVKTALKNAGAKRVSELKGDAIGQFIEELEG